jgi:nicotinamidase-related amidase
MELGYHITLIKDATAAFEPEGMRAAHEVHGPRFARYSDHRRVVGLAP